MLYSQYFAKLSFKIKVWSVIDLPFMNLAWIWSIIIRETVYSTRSPLNYSRYDFVDGFEKRDSFFCIKIGKWDSYTIFCSLDFYVDIKLDKQCQL